MFTLVILIPMQITEEDSYFSYLPLAHIFDQVIENYCISKGASIGFWQGVWTNCYNSENSLISSKYYGDCSLMPTEVKNFFTGH